LAPGIALGLVIYFSANALYTDFNPFVPNDPRPRNYEGSPTAWAAFKMISILFVVWAFRIWDDFTGVFSRIRAALAIFCAVALFFASQAGRSADEGMRSYDPSPTSSHSASGDPSIPLQEL